MSFRGSIGKAQSQLPNSGECLDMFKELVPYTSRVNFHFNV